MDTVWIVKLEYWRQENSILDSYEDLVSVERPSIDQIMKHISDRYDENVQIDYTYDDEVFSKYDLEVLYRDRIVVVYIEKAKTIEFT